MGWLNDLLPNDDQWDRFTTTLISAKDKIGDQLQIGNINYTNLDLYFDIVLDLKVAVIH